MVTLLRLELRFLGREPRFLPLEDSAMVAARGFEPHQRAGYEPVLAPSQRRSSTYLVDRERVELSSPRCKRGILPLNDQPTTDSDFPLVQRGSVTPYGIRTRASVSSRCRSIMAGRAGIEPADPALTTQREHLALSRPLMIVRLQNVPREGTFGPGLGSRTRKRSGLSRSCLPIASDPDGSLGGSRTLRI